MKQQLRMVAVAAGLGFAAAGAAEAQQHRFDFGFGGGGSWLSRSLDEDRLGSDAKAGFGAGWLTNAQATLWLSERLGVRANFGYTDRAFEFDGSGDLFTGGPDLVSNVNLWTGTGDLMLRLARPDESFTGVRMLPYLTGGVGARWVNPAGDEVTLADGTSASTFTVNDDTYALREDVEPVWRVGLGSDVRLSRGMSLRLELGDMIWSSPLDRVGPNGTTVLEPNISETQHELYGQVGLSFLLGIREMTRVALEPAPAPPPAQPRPQPERVPEPEPQEETMTVCVATPTGIEMVSATRTGEMGDTLVERNGVRTNIREAYTMREAADAQWFVTGQPLRLNAGREQIEFVATGTPVRRDNLVLLGTIDGAVVYVTEQDRQRMGASFDQLRNANDMSGYLMNNPQSITTVRDNLTTLYTPVRAIGCEFQELRQMELVIKR
jgi:opacity protein-like surface antigen